MGWTEEVCLATDVNYVTAAYQGRLHMFQMLFGKREEDEEQAPEEKTPPKKKITKSDILTFARTHNALLRAGKIKLDSTKK